MKGDRVFWLVLYAGVLLWAACVFTACGSVVPYGDAADAAQDLGASVDRTGRPTEVGAEDGGNLKADRETAATTETHPDASIVDAGASLPVCNWQIGHGDCPQPACDCQDR